MKINKRLFDHYGIDTTKDLGIHNRCPRPWDTLLIDKLGSCYACECQSWLPQSIGNLQLKELSEIVGSDIHQHLRESIKDGTYRFCNQSQCTYLASSGWPNANLNRWTNETPTHIKHVRLAIDDSCNLRCPSCRTRMIFHKEGSAYNLGVKLAEKVNRWLREQKYDVMLHIGSDGDPFASHIYRRLMEGSPRGENIKYSLLTNGLMYSEIVSRVPHVVNNLSRLGVSIDGATHSTYEKLRLGGRWDKIMGSLKAITQDKSRHGFRLEWHMVVQNDNWHEMSAMAKMASDHNVDRLFLNKIEDWNTHLDHEKQDFEFRIGYKEELARAMEYPIVRSWNLS